MELPPPPRYYHRYADEQMYNSAVDGDMHTPVGIDTDASSALLPPPVPSDGIKIFGTPMLGRPKNLEPKDFDCELLYNPSADGFDAKSELKRLNALYLVQMKELIHMTAEFPICDAVLREKEEGKIRDCLANVKQTLVNIHCLLNSYRRLQSVAAFAGMLNQQAAEREARVERLLATINDAAKQTDVISCMNTVLGFNQSSTTMEENQAG